MNMLKIDDNLGTPVTRIALILSLLCSSVAAQAPTEISGSAYVVDGDSLRIGATDIRLYGIDAPEWNQQCYAEEPRWWHRMVGIRAEAYACGVEAKDFMRSLLATSASVRCFPIDIDHYNRTVAVCLNNLEGDLGEQMVAAGHAIVYRTFAHLAPEIIERYSKLEREAKAAHRGVWRGAFDRPAQWRRLNASNR